MTLAAALSEHSLVQADRSRAGSKTGLSPTRDGGLTRTTAGR